MELIRGTNREAKMKKKGPGRPPGTQIWIKELEPIMRKLGISDTRLLKAIDPSTGRPFCSRKTWNWIRDKRYAKSKDKVTAIANALSFLSGRDIQYEHLTGDLIFSLDSKEVNWVPENPGQILTFANGLQYQRCEFTHKRTRALKATGKIYNLATIPPGKTLNDIEHWLYRHQRVAIEVANNHPNLISNYECGPSSQKAEWHVVDHWVEGVRLDELLADSGDAPMNKKHLFSRREIKRIAHCLLDALGALHAKGYILRTLNPGKIIITPEKIPVITDFELAKYLGDEPTVGDVQDRDTWALNAMYIAPQAKTSPSVKEPCDWYSWAAVMLSIASGVLLRSRVDADIATKIMVERGINKGTCTLLDQCRKETDVFRKELSFSDLQARARKW